MNVKKVRLAKNPLFSFFKIGMPRYLDQNVGRLMTTLPSKIVGFYVVKC